jgi:uncharacterized protein (TIGR03435 family)
MMRPPAVGRDRGAALASSALALIAVFVAAAGIVEAQVGRDAQRPGTGPRFEVASVKINKERTGDGIRVRPGGRYEYTNVTLRFLIASAYQRFAFDDRQSVGGPAWLDTERFDVIAQTGIGTPPTDADGFPGPLFAMMRALLEERFKLATHNEVRDQPIYELVVARRDGRLGPGVKRLESGCAAAMKQMNAGERPAPRPGRGPDCSLGGGPGRLQANAVSLEILARALSNEVGRHVVDKTGIVGDFDIDLTFAPEFSPGRRGGPPPDAAALAASDRPSIFTALQEQLGLKLESGRGPVDVLVVDRAEMPTEN